MIDRRNVRLLFCSVVMVAIAALAVGGVATGMFTADSARSDNPYPTLPPEKQLAVDSDEKARAAALENPPSPGATKAEDIVPQTDAPLATGIFSGADSQIRGYVFNTVWREFVDGKYLIVWTGFVEGDRTRGAVMRSIWAPGSGFLSDSWWHETTPNTGGFTIDSADGHLLALSTKAGGRFQFDADARTFTDESGDPVPTDSPTPTYPPHTPGPTISPEPETDTPTPTATAAPTDVTTAVPTLAAP